MAWDKWQRSMHGCDRTIGAKNDTTSPMESGKSGWGVRAGHDHTIKCLALEKVATMGLAGAMECHNMTRAGYNGYEGQSCMLVQRR